MTRLRIAFAVLLVTAGSATSCSRSAAPEELEVFAAASLRDVMNDLASQFVAEGGAAPVLNLAGSNTLAQQILAAPRGQVFVSADRDWIDVLEARGVADGRNRRRVFGNRLVVIAPAAGPPVSELERLDDLARLEFTQLVLAAPEVVPVGRYGRAALDATAVGESTLWRLLAPRVVPTSDARATLALVESTPGLVGIVYRTDAATSSRVRVIHEIAPPPESEIAYWAIAVGDTPSAESRDFLDFLVSPTAAGIAVRHGFVPLDR